MGSIRLGSFRGIKIGASWTVFLVIALVSFNIAAGPLAQLRPDAPPLLLTALGLLGALGLLASILLHELSHAVVAQRNGIGVKDITLWALGGVAQLEEEPKSPGADFRIAAAGPLTSLVLSVLSGGLALLVAGGLVFTLPSALFFYLAFANAALAVFNLLPATPLDGGRVLRAVVWKVGKNRSRAVGVASVSGRVLGVGLMLLGGYLLLYASSTVSGVWNLVLGFFLYTAAKSEATYTRTMDELGGRTVGDVLPPGMAVITDPSMPVSHVLHRIAPLTHLAVYPLLDAGAVLGVIRRSSLESVPLELRDQTPVVTLLEQAAHLPLDTELMLAVRVLGPRGVALVYDGSELRGVLTPADLAAPNLG